jgi:hypothetical protein
MSESTPSSLDRLPYVWDYDLDEAAFRPILAGRMTLGRLDRDWATVRLLEHASYPEIRRLLPFRDLVAGWRAWRTLVDWLPRNRPDLL